MLKKVIFVFILFVDSAAACSCIGLSLVEKFESANRVFTGELIQTGTIPETGKFEETYDIEDLEMKSGVFQVIKTYKGSHSRIVEVKTAPWTASCGVPLYMGRTYIIFQDVSGIIELCGGSMPIEKEDIQIMDPVFIDAAERASYNKQLE